MRKGLVLIATALIGSLFVEQSFAYKYDFSVDLTSKSKRERTRISLSDKGIKINSKTKKNTVDVNINKKGKRIRAGSKKGKIDVSF